MNAKVKKLKGEGLKEPTVARPPGVLMALPRKLIRLDPNQPRKSYSDESLKEMAESIRQSGIIQPLIVEFKAATHKVLAPDLVELNWRIVEIADGDLLVEAGSREMLDEQGIKLEFPDCELEGFYLVICGERRWRGAEIAGLAEVPSVVHRDVTQKEREDWQLIENNQREAVKAIEEAEAMARTLERRQGETPGYSKDDLAKELGMSRANVYNRFTLLRLHPPIRQALVDGKISTSVAGKIAVVPDPDQQKKLLERLLQVQVDDPDGEAVSVRDVQDIIDAEFIKHLHRAPWDEKFVPANSQAIVDGVRGMTCKACPDRSGNMVAEFPELKMRPNVCTNPTCFAGKCKAWWVKSAADKQAEGLTVLSEQEFRKVRKDYKSGMEEINAQNRYGQLKDLMGKAAPQPVLVATEEGLREFYPKVGAMAALAKNGVGFRPESKVKTPADKTAEAKRKKEVEVLRNSREALRDGLLKEIARGINGLNDKDAWALVRVIQGEDHCQAPFSKLLSPLLKGDRAKAIGQMAHNAFRGSPTDWDTGEWSPHWAPFYTAIGVDLAAEEKKRTEKAEVQFHLKEAVEDQLLMAGVPKMAASAKKKIAKAAKARWAKVKAAAARK